jgi:hypothetical protein
MATTARTQRPLGNRVSPLASYLAARITGTELESNTGNTFNSTANDQIRPSATTMPTNLPIYRRIRIPLVASYLAGRDIATESETMGTKSDMATTDQIRPIATTMLSIHTSICTPSHESRREGRIFSDAGV